MSLPRSPERAPELAGCLRSFEAEFDYVYRALRRHGVGAVDAEDLAQDVFVVMCRRWSDYDHRRPLRPWLAGIAWKVAHDHHRRSQRWLPGGLLELRDEEPLPDDRIAATHAREVALRALARLSEPHRAVLVMHDVDGLPMQEIAALLAVPVFTGYSRLRLARKAFARAVARVEARPAADRRAAALPAALLKLERTQTPAPAAARKAAAARARTLLSTPEASWPQPSPPGPRPRGPARVPAVAGAGLAALAAFVAVVWSTRASSSVPAPAEAAAAAGAPGTAIAALAPRAPSRRPLLAAPPSPRPAPAAAAAAGEAVGLARGLVGYWRFDEPAQDPVARDRSGSGNDCQLHPRGAVATRVPGALGGALALDGRSWLSCARLEPLARLGRQLSVALWVKTTRTGPAGNRQVFVARQLGTGIEDYFSLALWGGYLEVRGHLWQSGTRRRYTRSHGEWIHVAAVQRDDGYRMLYVDGVEVGRSNRSRPVELGGGTSLLTIGGAVNGPDPAQVDELFEGAVDELVIYDRALERAEIGALAARQQPL